MANKNELRIKGHSDNVIMLSGCLFDEIYPSPSDDTAFIKLPGGLTIKYWYGDDAIWRGKICADGGGYHWTIEPGEADLNLNDVVIIHQPVQYLTWHCRDERRGVIGDVALDGEKHSIFENLKKYFRGVEEFEDHQPEVRAILSGIEF